MDTSPKDMTTLLGELSGGKPEALANLVPVLYSELRRLASHYLKQERVDHTLQATALVHEAYLRLLNQREVRWENRNQFFGIAAQLMRRILVDYGRSRRAAKRGGSAGKVFLEESLVVCKQSAPDVVALDEALSKLAEVDSQQARIVELRFFGGLSVEQAADVLHISPATLKRNWNVAKAWLARELGRQQNNG